MKGWQVKKIGEVCTLKSGTTVNKSLEETSGDIPYLKVADMNLPENELEIVTSSRFLNHKFLKENSIFPVGTTIFPKRGGAILTNKKRLTTVPICTDLNIMGVIPSDILLPKFLYFYFLNIDMRELGSGSSIPQINNYDIEPLIISFPPLPQQKRVVAILDEAFEGIDRAIANTEKNLANSRELFESYLNAIFTQKGKGWVEKKLEDICKEITVGHVGSMASKYKDSGIPFLRSQNILPFRIKLDNVVFIDNEFHSTLKKSQLRPGDFAIVRTGYPGTAAVIPEEIGIVNCSDLVIVKPCENINTHYLCLFFNSVFGKTLVGSRLVGAAKKHFNITTAKKVLIPLPCLTEQNCFVTKMAELAIETQRLGLS